MASHRNKRIEVKTLGFQVNYESLRKEGWPDGMNPVSEADIRFS